MNNTTLQTILIILGSLGGFGFIIGAVAVAYSYIKKAPRQEKADVISSADQLAGFWKEQVEGFREVIKDLTAKLEKQKDDHNIEMKKVLNQLGVVQGQLAEKNKQSEDYLAILQNRDPETKKFMEFMMTATNNMMKILGEIHTMTKEEHDRDIKVTSTITKQ